MRFPCPHLFFLTAFLAASACSPAQAQTVQRAAPNVAALITVQPGARQTFAGLGTSEGNWTGDYQKLTAPERAELSRLVWHDLHLRTLRLWLNLDEYAPTPGARLTADFRRRYLDSGLVADAQRAGVTNLLLAPDGVPTYLKTKRDGGPADYVLRDEAAADYAALIADFIRQIRDETGVLLNVTGVQNEPNDLDRIRPDQLPGVVKALRDALDKRGLSTVKIVAPEAANVDGACYDTLDRLQADPAAWRALGGIATHSYSMAATEQAARYVATPDGTNAKDYWMTEASANGPEVPGDAVRGASLAGRFLSDMNHRVTHWVHFLGFESPDPNDNATRIVAYTAQPFRPTIFQKYYYYPQLAAAFDVGAVFRESRSTFEGEMTWTYGKKPRITVAAARNPDGTWGIGAVNFTAAASSFNDNPDDAQGYENGFRSRVIDVTVRLPELADSGDLACTVHRTNAHAADAAEPPATLHNGEITLRAVGPLDLVTVRTLATPP